LTSYGRKVFAHRIASYRDVSLLRLVR